ncbi:MAG: 2-oxoglutarate dehydrogenase complex dihydrolipoyllysine-residue succinyltransferase [Planctomycetes bacterium]|nr:2-oxoglutarate dehydrogenase complex dihydrolipoyllysine-residue succinyltransferase [Planctomycetota bacterium]
MAIDVKVPSVGESITEGTIARWLKKDGATVRLDEPILELETEKATQEIPAPAAGVLRISVGEGKTVAIGAVVATIEASTARASEAPAQKPAPEKPEPAQADGQKSAPTLSPAARRLAGEEKLDVAQLSGSGRGGVILKSDVQERLSQPLAASPAEAASPQTASERETASRTESASRETRQRMSAIRQRIAERLLASQKSTASLTTFNEADMSAISELRQRHKERFKEKHGVGLGFMSFFVKACVEALKTHPLANARIDGSDIVFQNFYDIGVAVSTEKGLMVPVLRDADRKNFAQIEKEIAALAAKARDGKISLTDLQGGTFTITNGGTFGSMLSTPILNPPQSAILGMHAVQKRPVVRDEQIVIRPMMYLALTYDHRLIDGREAVLFLVRVKECLENPARMLLEV